MAAVKPLIDLDYPDKHGMTLRRHYEQVNRWDWIEDKSPDIPAGGEYLWAWFWDIVGGKGGEEGFWVCLRAWSDMTGIRPTMWEVDVLKQLHSEYQKQINKKMTEK